MACATEVHETDADPSDAVTRYLGMALAQLEDFHTTYFKQEAEKQTVRAGGETQINLPTNQVINWPSIALHFNAKSWVPGRPEKYGTFAEDSSLGSNTRIAGGADVVSHYQDFVARLPEDGESLIQDLEVKSGGMDWVNVNDYYLIVKLSEMYLDESQLKKKAMEQGVEIAATDVFNNPYDRHHRPLTFASSGGWKPGPGNQDPFVFDDAYFSGVALKEIGGTDNSADQAILPNFSDGTDRPFESRLDPDYYSTEYTAVSGATFNINRPSADSGGLWQGSEWYPRPGHSPNYQMGPSGSRPSRMQVFSQRDIGTVFNIPSLKTIFNQMYPAVMDLSTVNNVTIRIRFRPPTCIPVSRVRDSYSVRNTNGNVTNYYFAAPNLFNDINGGTDASSRVQYSNLATDGATELQIPRFQNTAGKEQRRETPPTGNFEVTDISLTYESISMNSPLYARQVEQLANNGTLEFQFKNYYNYTSLHSGSTQTGFNTQCLDAVYACMQDPSADAPAPPVQMYNGRVIPRSHRFHHFGVEGWQFEINQASLPKNMASPAEAQHYFFDGCTDRSGYIDHLKDFTDYKYFMKVRLNFPYASCRLLSGPDIRGVNAIIRFVTRLNGGTMREIADPGDTPSGQVVLAQPTRVVEDQRNRRGQFYARASTNSDPTIPNLLDGSATVASSQLKPAITSASKYLRANEHVYPETYPNGVLLHMIFEFTSTLRIGAGRQAEVIQ